MHDVERTDLVPDVLVDVLVDVSADVPANFPAAFARLFAAVSHRFSAERSIADHRHGPAQ